VVVRHAIGDAGAAVVADDREALVPELRHDGDELRGDLALVVALAEWAAARCAAVADALEIAGDDGVARGERGRDPVPARAVLREAVQEQDGRSAACGSTA
jgi:hypothetical protein